MDSQLSVEVQNYFGVRCDPSLPYVADYTPPAKPDAKKQESISRKNFIELCEQLTIEDEVVFEKPLAPHGTLH